jgi:hypothetical protein
VNRTGRNPGYINIEENDMADIFAAVDLSGIVTFVTSAGVLVIGAALAFKAIGLGKRAVNKA